MQTSNKSFVVIVAAVLVAAFFMPWIKFFVGISAWDMIFGDVGKFIDTGFKYLALLIPIAGALIIYGAAFNNENYPLQKRLLFAIPILTLAIIILTLATKISGSGGRRGSDLAEMMEEGLFKVLGIGFWLTLIASIILPTLKSGSMQPTNPPVSPPPPNEGLPVSLHSATEQPLATSVFSPQYQRPQININLPKVDWNKGFTSVGWFLSKHKIALSIGAGFIVALLVVYNLFIKADPVKDGKLLAKNYCSCSEELSKNNLASMQSYYTRFDSLDFKSRLEARNALNSILGENQTKYGGCTQAADIKYKEKLADYSSSGGRNLYTFEQTYNSLISACNGSNNNEVIALQSSIDEKIKTIVDPEPDLEKIKADLIGQEIPGWKFSYLNEYKDAQILNTSKAGDRIEYQVKFNLLDNNANSEHDCEVMVVYLQGDQGWYLNNVNMNYITYVNTFYPDKFMTITPLQGCSWSADNNYKMLWRTSNQWYADEVTTGPDEGPKNIPNSSTYYIKSLEPNEIKVKFTYRPNN